jgi:hypothetical protein
MKAGLALFPSGCNASSRTKESWVVQVKQSCPNAAVVWNILVDHARVESLALAVNEAEGRNLLRHPHLPQWHISAIWCIGAHNDGPLEMTRRGASESIWPWPQGRHPPANLLSNVCSLKFAHWQALFCHSARWCSRK